MSVDLELWTREAGDIGEQLPRADQWDALGELYEYDGDGWLVTVFEPEAAPTEVPAELSDLVDGLEYRIAIGVEPSAPGADAWAFVNQVLETLGRALGGAAIDPESGRATAWTG